MEANIGHYYTAIDFFLKRRDYPDAFKAMELCRSRTLADVMAGGQKTKLDDKAEKSLSLYRNRMAQLDVLYGSYYARAKRAPGTSPDSMEALDARIRALENEAEDIRASMGPDASTALDLLSSEPATLDRIQGIARKDSLEILEYLVRDDRVILWYIAGDSVHVRNIILPRYEISKKSNLLLRSLAPHSPGSKTPPASGPCLDEQTATELFLFLIQPVLPWIRGKRLVVIPHDILWDVPFQILLDPATRAYVGESFRISYMPNASLLTNRRKLPNLKGKALLAVANPAISTSMKEIETISLNYGKQSVLLRSATKSALRDRLPGYNILHIASHGGFFSANAVQAFLLLGQEGASDTLRALDAASMPLGGYALVSLSACETGKVGSTRANENLGFERAFLAAGANNLILSSWNVESDASRLWMDSFHRNAQRETLAEAARLALVDTKKAFPNPSAWAPYFLVGK